MITPAHKHAAARVARLLASYVEAKAAPPTPRPWSALELAFYTALVRLLGDEAGELAALVASQGASAVDNGQFWREHAGLLQDELANALSQIARLGAQVGREELLTPVIRINWGLVNQQAVDWGQAHAAELVSQIEPTTRSAVREAVAEWTANGESLDGLTARIRALAGPDGGLAFSPARARLIAQTESTNAFAQGNQRAWQAADVARAIYLPSAHPGCRCRVQPVKLPDGSMGVRWMTVEDERVCTQPLQTPWGTVAGCRDLDNTVVSQGKYLGQHLAPTA